jgi:hypothetical protein
MPPRQGSAVLQAVSKASTFWSALHDSARHDRPVPTIRKGWDEISPDHPFLSVRTQVPLRPSLRVALAPPHGLGVCLAAIYCAEGEDIDTFESYMTRSG